MSEGSCDNKDWSYDAVNAAAHLRNKLHFERYSNKSNNIVIIFPIFTVFFNK